MSDKTDLKHHLDLCNKNGIKGWVIDMAEPLVPVEIEIFIDEELIAHTTANLFRQDLFDSTLGKGNCAFNVLIPDKFWDGVEHSVTVYEVKTKAVLKGSPKTFKLFPNVRGAIDICDETGIAGWVVNDGNLSQPVEIDIFIDEELIAHTTANLFRQDLFDAKLGNGNCAFNVPIPDKFWDGVEHRVNVYESVTKTVLFGVPKKFTLSNKFVGDIDDLPGEQISGWITNEANPQHPVIIDIYIDAELIIQVTANLLRQDTRDKVKNSYCGFNISIPNKFLDNLEHHVEILNSSISHANQSCLLTTNFRKPDNFVKLIAFYLPQFHPIPENDAWWGIGFTEWTNVTTAKPLFEEHCQPRIPTNLGYYDLRCAEVRDAQAELAKKYGIYGFCYYYYWFNGKRLLERPLNDMLASGTPDFPFCLCWANENWTRRWDGSDNELLIEQKYSAENDEYFARDLLPYFKDTRYIKVNAKPLLIVYRCWIIPDVTGMITRWREFFRREGIGEIYLCAALTFGQDDAIQYGFDAEVQFPPHNLWQNHYLPDIKNKFITNKDFTGKIFDYATVVMQSVQEAIPSEADYLQRQGRDITTNPRFLTSMLAWDNSPRTKMRAGIYHNFSLDVYAIWLRSNIEKTIERYSPQQRLVFINAWNEWGEGTYLEPDAKYGLGYLETTYNCLNAKHSTATTLAMLERNFTNIHIIENNLDKIVTTLKSSTPDSIFFNDTIFSNIYYLIKSWHREQFNIEQYQLRWWLETPIKNYVYTNKIAISGWFVSNLVLPVAVQIVIDGKLWQSFNIDQYREDVISHLNIQANGNNAVNSYFTLPINWKNGDIEIYVLFHNGELYKLASLSITKLTFFQQLTNKYNFSSTALNNLTFIQNSYLLFKPILFVLHDIYPAGAQFYLVNLLKWIKQQHPQFNFEVLIHLTGIDINNLITAYPDAKILLDELKAISCIYFLQESSIPQNIKEIQSGHYSLLYLNTSTLGDLLKRIDPFPSPIIVHVHELLFWIKYNFGKEKFQECLTYQPHFIACSQSVKTNLVENFDVDANNIKVVYPFIPTEFLLKQPLREKAVVKTELCIPDNEFIITCCGTLDFRKGADLIVPVIVALKQYLNNFKIVWIGGFLGKESQDHVLFTIEKAQVTEHIIFTGHKKNPLEYINIGDIFLLLSREDPFPLVMAEAALCHLPIIGFAGSGGIQEFIAGGAGVAVPYLNIELLAKAIFALYKEPEKIRAMGEVAYTKATTVYHQDKLAQEIIDTIQATIIANYVN